MINFKKNKKTEQGTASKKSKPKKQKGRIKIIPLIIVLVLIGGMVVFSLFFKNSLIKSAIQTAVESSFEAKCDISSVDFSILGAHMIINEFAVADKNDPMKNLFEFSSATINFDLTQLLLGRFICEEVSLLEMYLGTDRSVSGELKNKVVTKKSASDDSDINANEQDAFSSAISSVSSTVTSRTGAGIQQVIEQYNPQNILDSYMQNLQTPQLVDQARESADEITAYWLDATPQIIDSGTNLFKSVDELVKIQEAAGSDIERIRQAITSLSDIANDAKQLQAKTEESFERLQDDADTVQDLVTGVQKSVSSDTQFINDAIAQISTLSIDDGQRLLMSSFDTIAVSMLDSYYPLAKKGLELLKKVKANAENNAEQKKESAFKRLEGRTISFNQEMPTFLLKKASFLVSSSDEGISVTGDAFNISNDQDKINKSATANLSLNVSDYSGSLDVTVDIRTQKEESEPPVQLMYHGSNPINLSSITTGVPSLDADMDSSVKALFELNGDFEILPLLDFNSATLSTPRFEPELVYNLYNNVLESIDSFSVVGSLSYNESNGLAIDIETDADKKIADGLSSSLAKETEALKNRMRNEAKSLLTGYADDLTAELTEFNNAKEAITTFKARVDNLDVELENRRKELEAQITSQIKAEAQKQLDAAKAEAERIAEEKAKEAKEAAKSKVEDAASSIIKGFF